MANTQFLMQDKAQQVMRIAQKRQLILDWLKVEGHNSTEILSQVVGMKNQGAHNTLKVMLRDGLLRCEDLPTGAKMQVIYGLTPHSAMLASDFVNNVMINYFEPGRVSAWTLQHNLSVQKLRLQLQAEGWTNWKSDRQCKREGQQNKWLKVPDAISTNPDGHVVAIEVERSYKSLKRYAEIVSNYLQMMKQEQLRAVHYYCTGQCTAEKMQAIFQSIKQVKIKGELITLQPHHYQQFHFFNF